ncbi:MAG TPA: AAA family ATPase [Acidimicrobiales bacterium]|nr:AAA family ATPase [Acidimicrobiales bacterium]
MTSSPAGLVGREREVEVLTRLVEAARRGQSQVLVVQGDPGVGKTALVDHVVASATDARVLRAVGVESEMELPFAALHQLCSPVLDRLDGVPGPQRDALSKVFGLSGGLPPDRFLVGLGALSLLAGLGAEQPLVCFVDDAQWLDQASAQTMAFVARRLLADPVALVFAARGRPAALAGFPPLVVEELRDRDARALLASVLPFVLDRDVRERIIAEAGGNPLALLELPRDLRPSPLAGGFAGAATSPVSARIEEAFRRRLDALPADTRGLMLVAAAEPVGDPQVVLEAARALGIGPHAAAAAEAEGLVEIGARVRFRHPLVRSSAYHGATPDERSHAHRALAGATDPDLDPDRRAWHVAQATTGPDEDVAAELESSASRAQGRGGFAAAAAFLERAAALTLDPTSRARRTLAAAQARHLAGAHGAATEMLADAEAGPLDEGQRAAADLLRAEIAYTERRGNDAPELLVRAARRLEPLDARTARDTYLDAVMAAHFAGRLAHGTDLRQVAEAALRAPQPPPPPTASDRLLDGLATALIDGYAAAVPLLQDAVRAFRGPTVTPTEQLRWLWPAAHVAMALWDDESYELLATRHIEIGRASGLLAVLPTALTTRAVASAFMGDLALADQLIAEMRVLTDAMQIPVPPYGPLFVAGWRGREASAAAVDSRTVQEVTERGEGAGLAFADYARAVLGNGLGRYGEALDAAESIDAFATEGFVIYTAGLVELIEAAVRSGAPERATDAFERLTEATLATGTDWGAGLQARSHALLSEDSGAEDLYRAAVERLGRTRIRPQLARAHLVYGEWLRRQNRRVEARDQLRVAYDMLTAMGVEAFAERARHELLATGETVRRRTVETVTDLTAQEAHIARLAVEGHTNPEIGTQLFISPRTVEWHLRKVFTKLGIASRRELRDALPKLATVDLIA